MQYWYVSRYTKEGEPIWARGKAYGFRRKNGSDQVYVRTLHGFEWIFATVVSARDTQVQKKSSIR